MSYFNEHALELSIMELFQDEGYLYLQGDKIHRERSEVLLVDDLKQYLYNRYAKDGITTNEVESIVFSLRTISGTIYEANKTVYKLISDGFGRVAGWSRIGHRDDRGKSAAPRRLKARRGSLRLGNAGIAEMDVDVDEARKCQCLVH